MEFVTYLKENNLLVINSDESYLVFKWTGRECIVAKCSAANMGEADLTNAKIIFAWATSTYNVEEVQKALYKITGKAFDLSFDEYDDPIFTEWGLKDIISVSYYYDALYKEFNK